MSETYLFGVQLLGWRFGQALLDLSKTRNT
jgi:hypothetical protein